MRKILTRVAAYGALTILPAFALAHEEAEHAKTAEPPKCEAMSAMDHSKMKKDDPVMQAMMKKCMKTHAKQSETEGETSHQKSEGHKKHDSH
ncbi:hypothetical protein [Teredinibacter haidensis]|uniref:hypothetical protein n=1 Tax=Teredinibacter haidensis TaxID=2731755 RepID=UPI000948B34C|nr:hypothetical protein [Teredinibacter haidensis]